MLRRTKKPTLVVPIDDDAESGFANLLVAVDLSPASKGVVEQAIQLAGDDSPRLTVVHAAKGIESAAAVQSPARWMVPSTGRIFSKMRDVSWRPSWQTFRRRLTHASSLRRAPTRRDCGGSRGG